MIYSRSVMEVRGNKPSDIELRLYRNTKVTVVQLFPSLLKLD